MTLALSTEPTAPSATTDRKPSLLARIAPHVPRVLLGLCFFVTGLDGFLHVFPQPAPDALPKGAAALGAAFYASGYMFPLIKGTELLTGALLLSNRFVPLALVILAPVLVNIVCFHAFLAPSGVAIPIVLAVLALVLAWTRRDAYRPLFRAR
jgi:hypothetical protein